MLKRIQTFMDSHNRLSWGRFGFRKGKSSIDAFLSLVDMVEEEWENREHTASLLNYPRYSTVLAMRHC